MMVYFTLYFLLLMFILTVIYHLNVVQYFLRLSPGIQVK